MIVIFLFNLDWSTSWKFWMAQSVKRGLFLHTFNLKLSTIGLNGGIWAGVSGSSLLKISEIPVQNYPMLWQKVTGMDMNRSFLGRKQMRCRVNGSIERWHITPADTIHSEMMYSIIDVSWCSALGSCYDCSCKRWLFIVWQFMWCGLWDFFDEQFCK